MAVAAFIGHKAWGLGQSEADACPASVRVSAWLEAAPHLAFLWEMVGNDAWYTYFSSRQGNQPTLILASSFSMASP